MTSFTAWLLVSIALCSSLTVQEPSYGLLGLPALLWQSRFQQTEFTNTQDSALPSGSDSPPSRQEHHVRVLMDHEAPSPILNEVASADDNSDGQGEVLLALPDTDVLPYLGTATAPSPGLDSSSVSSVTLAPLPSLESISAGAVAVLLPSSPGPTSTLRAGESSETSHQPAGRGSSGLFMSPAGRRSSLPTAVKEELSGLPGGGPAVGPSRPWSELGPVSAGRGSDSRRTDESDPEPPQDPLLPPLIVITDTAAAAAVGGGASSDDADPLPGQPAVEPIPAHQKAAMTNLAKARASTIVGLTFGAMSLLLVTWYGVRKFRDRWHHRHYRSVNFLVDGMYNT